MAAGFHQIDGDTGSPQARPLSRAALRAFRTRAARSDLHGSGVVRPQSTDGGAVPCKAPATLPGELRRRVAILACRRFLWVS